jgi:hypothetical protein
VFVLLLADLVRLLLLLLLLLPVTEVVDLAVVVFVVLDILLEEASGRVVVLRLRPSPPVLFRYLPAFVFRSLPSEPWLKRMPE